MKQLGLALMLTVLVASEAEAQYKNTSFSAFGGVALLVPGPNPSFWPGIKNGTAPADHPFALANAMFSFDLAFKISLESWFLKTGLNIGLLQVQGDRRPEANFSADPTKPAFAEGGLVFWLEGMFAPRVYVATDKVRPYFELGLRIAGAIYTTPVTASAIPANFRAMPAVYGAFGIEFIVARDIGIALLVRYSRYLIVNFPGFNLLEGQAGIVSYF